MTSGWRFPGLPDLDVEAEKKMAKADKTGTGQLAGEGQPTVEVAEEKVFASESERVVAELTGWWRHLSINEVLSVAPKAVEYGSRDLVEMGRTLGRVAGREPETEVEAAELGVWFYVLGKMARWTAAVERGDLVSDDTLHDLGIYVKMVQRMRYTGQVWPK